MKKIKLTISTPKGIFFEQDVDIVTVKTPNGYIGLQRNRLPFISSVEISTMFIKNDSENKIVAIGGGLVFVEKTYIDIFTDDIEWKENLNKTEIEKIIEETQKRLEQIKKDNIERNKHELMLKKAINKLNTLTKSI